MSSSRPPALLLLGVAGVAGCVLGLGSTFLTPQRQHAVVATASALAVTTGAIRERTPQSGDRWGGCNDARAAGTAPIYRGEPGYRADMDGDDDGVACEPVPG